MLLTEKTYLGLFKPAKALATFASNLLSFPEPLYSLALLRRTERKTHCPYKGEASYYAIHAGGRVAENAIWSYEKPIAGMDAIAEYVAFYPDRVDRIERVPV